MDKSLIQTKKKLYLIPQYSGHKLYKIKMAEKTMQPYFVDLLLRQVCMYEIILLFRCHRNNFRA